MVKTFSPNIRQFVSLIFIWQERYFFRNKWWKFNSMNNLNNRLFCLELTQICFQIKNWSFFARIKMIFDGVQLSIPTTLLFCRFSWQFKRTKNYEKFSFEHFGFCNFSSGRIYQKNSSQIYSILRAISV